VTYGNQKQNASDHRSKCSATHLAGIYVAKDTYRKRTNCRNYVGSVKDEMICDFIRGIGTTRDDHHDWQLFAPEGLKIRKG